MIVADTGAIVALIDRDDRHHEVLAALFQNDPSAWVLPWAILPEVDYIVSSRIGRRVASAFRQDLAEGAFVVEWGSARDVGRAVEINRLYEDLDLGLVDGVVMAVAERLGALAIATLDERDFAPVEVAGAPALWPRDA